MNRKDGIVDVEMAGLTGRLCLLSILITIRSLTILLLLMISSNNHSNISNSSHKITIRIRTILK